jgi:hypothetical protein
VVTGLTFLAVNQPIADGVSRATVTVSSQIDGRDPKLTALLHLSDGTWVDKPDAGDAHALTVTMAEASEQRDVILPATAETISVSATIDGVEQSQDLQLVGTPVTKVDPVATGILPPASATSGNAISLSALLEVVNGSPSVGTYVDFAVDVLPEGKGYPAAQTVIVGSTPTVTATYNALPGAESMTVTVTVRPYMQPSQSGTTQLP